MTARELLEDIDEGGDGLTPFEVTFVESITKQAADPQWKASPKQLKLLQRIHEQRVPA